jgi:muramidase (phage lysozyme)
MATDEDILTELQGLRSELRELRDKGRKASQDRDDLTRQIQRLLVLVGSRGVSEEVADQAKKVQGTIEKEVRSVQSLAVPAVTMFTLCILSGISTAAIVGVKKLSEAVPGRQLFEAVEVSSVPRETLRVGDTVGSFPVTSAYGSRKPPAPGASSFHNGVDVGMPIGTQLKTPFFSEVACTTDAGYGTYAIVTPRGIPGLSFHLGHLSQCYAGLYQAGGVVAQSGNTGISSGAHLHVTQVERGQKVDPNAAYVRGFLSGTLEQPETDSTQPEPTAGTPEERAILDTIAYAEGTYGRGRDNGYSVVVGYGHTATYDRHPSVDVVWQTGQPTSDAAGRYQFLSTTYAKHRQPDFSPASQDRAALSEFAECGGMSHLKAGRVESALRSCSTVWASLPSSLSGQPQKHMADLLRFYAGRLAHYKR